MFHTLDDGRIIFYKFLQQFLGKAQIRFICNIHLQIQLTVIFVRHIGKACVGKCSIRHNDRLVVNGGKLSVEDLDLFDRSFIAMAVFYNIIPDNKRLQK